MRVTYNKFIDHLKILGELRDGILVLGTLLYLSGYLTCLFYSFFSDLRSIPTLDLQYFVVGIPTFLMIILTYSVVKFSIKFFFKVWPDWYHKKSTTVKRIFLFSNTLIFGAIIIFCAIYFMSSFKERSILNALIVLIFMTVMCCILLLFLEIPGNKMAAKFTKIIDMVIINFVPLLFSIIVILIYLNFIYPKIPQALGGAKPEFAMLDLDKNMLSKETIKELATVDYDNANHNIIRSKKVKVLFSGTTKVVVTLLLDNGDSYTIEIKNNAINSFKWCD